MSSYFHALVWIDHREAKVFHFDAEHGDEVIVRNSHAHQNLHHKANSSDSGHVSVDKEYLQRVVAAISTAGAILIVGPGSAKAELRAYVQHVRPDIAARISKVESIDHPTEGQLLAHGRRFFAADERMRARA